MQLGAWLAPACGGGAGGQGESGEGEGLAFVMRSLRWGWQSGWGGKVRGFSLMAVNMSGMESPWKGRDPHTQTYRHTPAAQTSTCPIGHALLQNPFTKRYPKEEDDKLYATCSKAAYVDQ